MTKVDKTETKYECKINALTTQAMPFPLSPPRTHQRPERATLISRGHRPRKLGTEQNSPQRGKNILYYCPLNNKLVL